MLIALAAWALRTRPGYDGVADLVAAVGTTLPFDARLTGGFPPPSAAVRRSGEVTQDLSPDVRIAIAQIEKHAMDDRRPKALRDLGIAYLVGGEVDKAISALEEATSTGDDAGQWSDLSAAYLVKADRTSKRRIEFLARALEASSRSLRQRVTSEAQFNQSLALDGFAPYLGGTDAWSEYIRAERDPRWVAAADRHLRNTRSIPDPRAIWEQRKARLLEELDRADRAAIDDAAALFPEASIELFERDLIGQWAGLVLSRDAGRASQVLQRARLVADAIQLGTGDSMQVRAADVAGSAANAYDAARAHRAYADGVAQYDANDYAASRESFDAALDGFTRIGSPYAAWASLQIVTILFQARRLDEAETRLAAVEAVARAGRFPTLLGRVLWMRGLTQSKKWRLTDAMSAFREAADVFARANEKENHANLDSVTAANLRMLGDYNESWEYNALTLEGLSHVRKPIQRYLFLFNASLFASSQGLFEAALRFQNGALRAAQDAGDAPLVEALTQRAAILVRQQRPTEASRDLDEARSRLSAVRSDSLQKYLQAEVDVLRSDLAPALGQAPPIADLRRAVTFFTVAEPAIVPRLQLSLARAHFSARETAQAEDSFAKGISLLERQQQLVGDEALKISYFDESWDLFPEMIEFQSQERHDAAKAFEFAERSRARSLLRGNPLTLPDIQQALPDAAAMVYYATLSDRVLTWLVTRAGTRMFEKKIPRDRLVRLVSQYVARIASGQDQSASGRELSELLIEGFAPEVAPQGLIVFVPDGELQRLPFATLKGVRTARYLIEDHPILVSPSASFFATTLARAKRLSTTPVRSGLLVGDPRIASSPSRPRLPGAEAEAGEAAQFYGEHQVLTGAAATKAKFLELAPRFDVVHFGGHALANAEYPQLSRLLFATDRAGDEQPLYAYEIADLRLPQARLVVLAACSTAVGAVSHGEGVMSVARPFLAIGVPAVIASQWDVDDRGTQRLFIEFHRAFVRTQDAARSLQLAQMALLRSGDTELALPVRWGAFLALGTAAH